MEHPLFRGCILLMIVMISRLLLPDVATSGPLTSSDEDKGLLFYCIEPNPLTCTQAGARGSYPSYGGYIKGVVAAEWPAPGTAIHNSDSLEPFKAGSVVVRTFAERFAEGCGAKLRDIVHYQPMLPPHNFEVMYFLAQRFDSNRIKDEHEKARETTNGQVIRRVGDNQLACAKHNSNTGNPTAAHSAEPTTLQSVVDPVHNNNCNGCVGAAAAPGISHNGSAAWFKGIGSWQDYRQLLSHYYGEIILENASSVYRWVWLDVDADQIVHTGTNPYYGEYYGPTFNAPASMEVGQSYAFSLHLQNTSLVKWRDSGSTRTQIALYWDGNRNTARFFDLDEEMDPGEDDRVTVRISPPSAGTHCLTVDLVRNGLWFSDQSSPAWPVLRKCISVRALDTTPPSNPNRRNGSHDNNRWSNDNTIHVEWGGAADDRTPADDLVYSIEWTPSPTTIPNTGVNETEAETTSPPLADGRWWLHVRTRDAAGNWSSVAAHFGPFLIDTAPPSGSHQAPAWSPTTAFTVTWQGADAGAAGILFDFDDKINNASYRDWFETTAAPGSAVYDRGAEALDRVTVRACIRDGAGNAAVPQPCTVSQTHIRTTPYLVTEPTAIRHCFLLAETGPISDTLQIKNEGPGRLDWTATLSHAFLVLAPTVGTDVSSDSPARSVYTITHPAEVGRYTGVITVSSPSPQVSNSPLRLPVTVRVEAETCTHHRYLPVIVVQD